MENVLPKKNREGVGKARPFRQSGKKELGKHLERKQEKRGKEQSTKN